MKNKTIGLLVVTLGTMLAFGPAPARATYPGANGTIAFSLQTKSGWQINTIRPNGHGLQQLTSVTGSALDSDWSPDGTKIVFDVDPTGGLSPCRLEIMNADGSNIVDLTPAVVVADGGCAYNPTFTPNGKRIVFVEQRCPSDVTCLRNIRIKNLQGGGNGHSITRKWTPFPPGGYDLHGLRVSPDGRTVLFVVVNETNLPCCPDGNRKALYSVRMNGTQVRQVVPFRFDVCVCGGDWAPNGKRIVSSSQAGPTPVPGIPSNLFTVRPDGSGLRSVTHSGSTDVYIAAGSYSPDGRWILYKRITAKGAYRLMRIHPSGLGATVITTAPANVQGRDWGPAPS